MRDRSSTMSCESESLTAAHPLLWGLAARVGHVVFLVALRRPVPFPTLRNRGAFARMHFEHRAVGRGQFDCNVDEEHELVFGVAVDTLFRRPASYRPASIFRSLDLASSTSLVGPSAIAANDAVVSAEAAASRIMNRLFTECSP